MIATRVTNGCGSLINDLDKFGVELMIAANLRSVDYQQSKKQTKNICVED
jgi:hypothetical protein